MNDRAQNNGGWVWTRRVAESLEIMEAAFRGRAFEPHRHDHYAIGLTRHGVQCFDYRGRSCFSGRGDVMVLHPDEIHDGREGDERGYSYQILYVDPAEIALAARTLRGRPGPLPFTRDVVLNSADLQNTIRAAFRHRLDPLAVDGVILELTQGLLASSDDPGDRACRNGRVDFQRMSRVRDYIDSARYRVIRSDELAAVAGLSRYELARQFRRCFGTSPNRYLHMRRLAGARQKLLNGGRIADIATESGYADQAHFTRMFKAAHGVSPSVFRCLHAAENQKSRVFRHLK